MKMAYRITPNFFAPKEFDLDSNNTEYRKTHSISFNRCNFKCKFCEFHFRDQQYYREYDKEEFEDMVDMLIQRGKNFKFTGGESTLNPNLLRDLEIVRKFGGKIYLDTNGSNPSVVKKALEKKLVDVVGISMKGVSQIEALEKSGVQKSILCWDNVLETIKICSEDSNVKVIVTYVCYNDVKKETLFDFAKILSKFDNVYLKLNNLIGDKHHSSEEMKPVSVSFMKSFANELIEKYPEWKDRVILILGKDAISDYKSINFQ